MAYDETIEEVHEGVQEASEDKDSGVMRQLSTKSKRMIGLAVAATLGLWATGTFSIELVGAIAGGIAVVVYMTQSGQT
ncbi:hypothetical protein GOV10_00950, partial [Candidatus Woesearchaeota archaeon]|nr:hypothetical protein [Candidatus Woesearchaeota archaeon]